MVNPEMDLLKAIFLLKDVHSEYVRFLGKLEAFLEPEPDGLGTSYFGRDLNEKNRRDA